MSASPSDASMAGKAKTWIKTIVGTLAGLFSGAVLMYLTPLIDRVIKPAKPVANFGYQAEGLTATFHNRSSGGSAGWWDFGDGSPLEPVAPHQDIVTHTYPRGGEFSAKLSLRNLIGDESERNVTVRVELPRNEPPAITSLDVVPVSPGSYAPATFRLVSKAKEAQLFIWDYGDDRPLDIGTDKDNGQEKMVTFDKPGAYIVKVAAVSGTQAAVKSDIIQVNVPPTGAVTAILTVSDEATRVETKTKAYTFADAMPPSSPESIYRISKQVPADTGYTITDVKLPLPPGRPTLSLQGKTEMLLDPAMLGIKNARNLRLQVAADRRSVQLTGELVRETGMLKRNAPAPTVALPVQLVQERRVPATRSAVPMTAMLTVPGSAILNLPPLPTDWVEPRRQARVELREGERVLWQESQLNRNALVTVHNKRCIVTATPTGNQVRIDLVEVPIGLLQPAN